MISAIKEKIAGIVPGLSGVTSFLGGYQVCHNICLSLIAGLSIIGITVQGMPLEFLQGISTPLWWLGIAFMALSVYMYVKKKCISARLIKANAGLLAAAAPFAFLEPFRIWQWVIGFGIVAFVLADFVYAKFFIGKKEEKCHEQ